MTSCYQLYAPVQCSQFIATVSTLEECIWRCSGRTVHIMQLQSTHTLHDVTSYKQERFVRRRIRPMPGTFTVNGIGETLGISLDLYHNKCTQHILWWHNYVYTKAAGAHSRMKMAQDVRQNLILLVDLAPVRCKKRRFVSRWIKHLTLQSKHT